MRREPSPVGATAPILAVQATRALLPLCPVPWDGWDLTSVPWDMVAMDTRGLWMWGCGATGEPGGGLLAGSSGGVAGWMDEEIWGLVRCCWRWKRVVGWHREKRHSCVLLEPVSIKAPIAMELKPASTKA